MQFFKLCKTFCSQLKTNVMYKPLHSNSRLNIFLIACPSFHTSFCCCVKSFPEYENEYAHNVMENNSHYKLSIIKHPLILNNLDVITTDDSDVFTEFILTTKKNLAFNLNLEKPEFNKLIFNLANSLSTASDHHIIKILHFLCMWPPTPKTYSSNYKLLWNTLDYECTRRLTSCFIYPMLQSSFKLKHLTDMNLDTNKHHLVFVYGTLKRGEPNYEILQDCTKGEALYLGKGITLKKWPLVIASKFNIPFLLYNEGKGNHVKGEIFKVDQRKLEHLDELECHPKYYQRKIEEVQMVSKENENASTICKPWIYFLVNFKSNLLELPFLEDYSSKGDHGLEYISRYQRPPGYHYHTEVMNI